MQAFRAEVHNSTEKYSQILKAMHEIMEMRGSDYDEAIKAALEDFAEGND